MCCIERCVDQEPRTVLFPVRRRFSDAERLQLRFPLLVPSPRHSSPEPNSFWHAPQTFCKRSRIGDAQIGTRPPAQAGGCRRPEPISVQGREGSRRRLAARPLRWPLSPRLKFNFRGSECVVASGCDRYFVLSSPSRERERGRGRVVLAVLY